MKIPADADWCEHCREFYLPILGVRDCPFCEKRGRKDWTVKPSGKAA